MSVPWSSRIAVWVPEELAEIACCWLPITRGTCPPISTVTVPSASRKTVKSVYWARLFSVLCNWASTPGSLCAGEIGLHLDVEVAELRGEAVDAGDGVPNLLALGLGGGV